MTLGTQRPGAALVAQKAISYRAVGAEGRGRVAVKVRLFNPGMVPCTPMGAALVGSSREALTGLTVWPLKPILPEKYGSITSRAPDAGLVPCCTFTIVTWAARVLVGYCLRAAPDPPPSTPNTGSVWFAVSQVPVRRAGGSAACMPIPISVPPCRAWVGGASPLKGESRPMAMKGAQK